MERFPAFIDLKSRPVVIIGGGAAALAKACLALVAEAQVRIVSPRFSEELRAAVADDAELIAREPAAADFERAVLAFIATEEPDEAAVFAEMARSAGALVNVVDQPGLCDFTTPSIIDRGKLTVAISTNGAAPVLGRKLRADVEALLPARAGALADFAARYREAVKAKIPAAERRVFWEAFFAGPIAALVLEGDERRAHEQMLTAINRPHSDKPQGVVHIVGAGPGDPDLLTLKALRLLQAADVILYDRLVSNEILSLARRDAARFYVGKAKARHAVPQSDIEAKMIKLARDGKTVVRLKGGDPFVFGRGGEELAAMRAAGVEAFVTPGVTAAIGGAAAAGMALTHRDYSQSVTFVTGHAKNDEDPDLDWAALAALKNTLVVYMGVGKAASIADNLIAHGRARSTPVAVIENATREDQLIAKGALQELPELIAAAGITGPALLVIGEVAALAKGDELASFARETRRIA